MTIKSSGRIFLTDITTELGVAQSGFRLISPAARDLAGKPTGRIMLTDFYGKSNFIERRVLANTTDLHLFTLAGSPAVAAKYRFIVEADVIVGQVSSLAAVDIGQFPSGSEIEVYINGKALGKGGAANGGIGGDAIKANYPNQKVTIWINGEVLPGGGGGGKGGTGGAGGTGGQGVAQVPGPEQYSVSHELYGGYTFMWTEQWASPTPAASRQPEGVVGYWDVDLYSPDGRGTTFGTPWVATAWDPVYGNPTAGYFPTSYGSFSRGSFREYLEMNDGENAEYRYGISQTTTTYTAGGAGGPGGPGGNGGSGKGYNQNVAAGNPGTVGSSGAAGSTNAGYGGTGGTGGAGGAGGDWGVAGSSGLSGNAGQVGANGNYSSGLAGAIGNVGSAGGLPGLAIRKGTADVTVINNGVIAGQIG